MTNNCHSALQEIIFLYTPDLEIQLKKKKGKVITEKSYVESISLVQK